MSHDKSEICRENYYINANHSPFWYVCVFNRPIKIISVPYNFIDSHFDVSNSMWFIVKHMKSQWQQHQRIKWLHLPQDICIKHDITDFMY